MVGGAATTVLTRDGERARTTGVVADEGTLLGTGMGVTTDGLLVLASVTAELIAVEVFAVRDTLISDMSNARSTHDAISNMHYAYNMLNIQACFIYDMPHMRHVVEYGFVHACSDG